MAAALIRYRIFESPTSASAHVASEIAHLIRERNSFGRNVVLGLTANRASLPLFAELIYLHREEGLSFRNVITFNLSEYLGSFARDAGSLRAFMQRHLFDHIDLPPNHIHFLPGKLASAKIAAACRAYENQITRTGGIDIQLLGIGRYGQIGMNVPGSAIDSRTRMLRNTPSDRDDRAEDGEMLSGLTTDVLTMGCGTILEARRIILMAWGARKSSIIRRAICGPVVPKIPASYLATHPAAQVFLDASAASLLVKEGC